MSLSPLGPTEMPRAWIWLTIAAGVSVAAIAGFLIADRLFLTNAETEGQRLLATQTITGAALVSSSFERFADPLILIANTPDVTALARAERAGGIDLATESSAEELRRHTAAVFAAAMKNGRYDKLRYIDANGREQVKVVLEGDTPVTAAREDLKDESFEDYFVIPRDRFGPGEVYSSKPRLSEPSTAAAADASIRISTGIFNALENFQGIIVANVKVNAAFNGLHGTSDMPGPNEAAVITENYVIDARGQYVFGPGGTDLFGLETGSGRAFGSDWGAAALARSLAGEVSTANGHVILASPFKFGPTNDWTMLTIVEESALNSAGLSPYLGAGLMGSLALVASIFMLLMRQFTATRRQQAIAQELRELDEAKSEFVALASHELRTPLTGVYGFASLLADTGELSERHQEWANHIRDESSRLAKIVDDLLNLSTIESGSISEEDGLVDLDDVIQAVLQRFDGASEQHEIVLEPSTASESAVVLAEQDRLIEVVSNLVDNAIKYSPDGGAVRIACSIDDGFARISVTDEGVGIAASDLELLFGKFQRISRPGMESIRSTGLGLYIVKLLLNRIGGDITVSSVDGVGSTFTVILPLAGSAQLVAA